MSEQHPGEPGWPNPGPAPIPGPAPATEPAPIPRLAPPPPPPPPGYPPAYAPPADPSPYVSQPRPKKGGKGKIVVAVAAVVILLAGALVTFMAVADKGGKGAANPGEATQDLFAALHDNDILGMLDSLAPSERSAVKDQLQDMVDEAKRLGVLKDDLNLNKVPGFTFDLQGLKTTAETVNDHIANVRLNAGHYTVSSHVGQLPLGDLLQKYLGDAQAQAQDQTTSGDFGEDEAAQITTVKEDGGWYVSIYYSVAEQLRKQAGAPAPDPKAAIPGKGAESPEAAVRALIGAGLALDARRAIELTPPDELAVLHEYGPLLVDEADKAKADEDPFDGAKLTVKDLQFDTEEVTGGTKVIPTKLDVTVATPNGNGELTAQKVDGSCVEYKLTADGEDPKVGKACADDLRQVLEGEDLPPSAVDLLVRVSARLGDVGIVTTKVDGKWYISPSRTYSEFILTFTRAIQRSDIEAIVNEVSAKS